MERGQYLYHINYQGFEEPLCRLEQRAVFKIETDGKTFESDMKFEPSHSPFMKSRMDKMMETDSFEKLLNWIEEKGFDCDGFFIMYMLYQKDDPSYKDRKALCRSVGYAFLGEPDFKNPSVVYGITNYHGRWLFGEVHLNNGLWRDHNNKPYSYSSSLGIHLAKALVNIGTEGNLEKRIIDPCCGVGTVLLEAAFAGYKSEGREIMEKVAKSAQLNMAHYNYEVPITLGDMHEIGKHYDVALVDLPYGISTDITATQQAELIRSAFQIADRLVVVSTEDINHIIKDNGMTLLDTCSVSKNYGHIFYRHVWVLG